MLRQRPARAASFSPPVRQTLPRRGSTDLSVTKTRELFELAESLGFCVQKTTLFETELRHSMLKRMQRRRGQFVYQATAFSISGFARPRGAVASSGLVAAIAPRQGAPPRGHEHGVHLARELGARVEAPAG